MIAYKEIVQIKLDYDRTKFFWQVNFICSIRRREVYSSEMMKIERKPGKRILIDGKDLRLDTHCINDNEWFWCIYTKEGVNPKLFSENGERFKLLLKMDRKYPYSAYESHMYCIYLGYKYDIENILH